MTRLEPETQPSGTELGGTKGESYGAGGWVNRAGRFIRRKTELRGAVLNLMCQRNVQAPCVQALVKVRWALRFLPTRSTNLIVLTS